MSIFSKSNYREIIQDQLSQKKSLDKMFNYQNMASFMRIQKPYLSKVLNGHADFNSDQLFKACEFLNLKEEETDYLLLLLEYERSQFPERKKLLEHKIRETQNIYDDASQTTKRKGSLTAKEFDTSELVEFYLDPLISVVHVFLSIPRYRKDISAISRSLNIPEKRLSEILIKLESMGIISAKGENIKILIPHLHLPKNSKMIIPYQKLMTQLCAHKKGDMPFSKKKSMNVTFAASEAARREIDFEFNKFIEKVRKIAENSRPTDCYQLSFDLFPWS